MGAQLHECAQTQRCMGTRVQECMGAKVHGYWASGLQDLGAPLGCGGIAPLGPPQNAPGTPPWEPQSTPGTSTALLGAP